MILPSDLEPGVGACKGLEEAIVVNSDINKTDIDGTPPVFVACLNGKALSYY